MIIAIFVMYMISGHVYGDDNTIQEDGIIYIAGTKSDSFAISLLKRVAIRDSVTDCILGVKYHDSATVDLCFTPYLDFSISEVDSYAYKIKLYPIDNGSIINCTPIMDFEEYIINRNSRLTDEYKKYKDYTEIARKKGDEELAKKNAKLKELTKHNLKAGCSVCDVFDSLGTACKVSYFSYYAGVFNKHHSGYVLIYPEYSITIKCLIMYCSLVNIFSNTDPENRSLYGNVGDSQSQFLNQMLEDCKKQKVNRWMIRDLNKK